MNKQLPNGQDLIDDAYTNGKWARKHYATFKDWQKDRMYEIARSRVEQHYGRGEDYDNAARNGWKDGGTVQGVTFTDLARDIYGNPE